MRNLIFRDGTKTTDKEYQKGHFTYAEIKKFDGVGQEGGVRREPLVYMRRWYLLCFPRLFSIRVHHIQLPDLDRWPHDHPWHFLSIILRGTYWEEWCKATEFRTGPHAEWVPSRYNRRRRFNFKWNTDLHKITRFERDGSWTLIITGPEAREWGFRTNQGWVSRVALNLGASEPRGPHGREPD